MLIHSSERQIAARYEGKEGLMRYAEEICKSLLDRNYELVNLIDVKNREYQFFWSKEESWHGIPQEGDYDEVLNKFVLKELPDEESRQILLHLKIDDLTELLQRESMVRRRFQIRTVGGDRWKLLEYNYLTGADGKILQVISDIHDEQTLKERLKRESYEKEKAIESKRISLENIGQEICNMMHIVMETSDELLEEVVSGEMIDKLSSIKSACVNLQQTAKDMNELAIVTSGELPIICSEYRMSSFLMDIANMVKARLRRSAVRFFLDVDPSLPEHFYGDDVRVNQLLMHVLEAAVSDTENGSVSMEVSGKKRSCGRYLLEIIIKDTGTGSGVENPEESSGSENLGLAISANLARLMDGGIYIEREEGAGSTYHITLEQKVEKFTPLIPAVADSVRVLVLGVGEEIQVHIVHLLNQLNVEYEICESLEESDELGEFTHVLTSGKQLLAMRKELEARFTRKRLILLLEQEEDVDICLMRYCQVIVPLICLQLPRLLNSYGMKRSSLGMYRIDGRGFPFYAGRILAVDNSRVNLEKTCAMLEPYMIEVDMAQNGKQALDMVRKTSYSLILMDQMMPVMDGLETLKEIRALGGRYEKIPVIALTASANPGIRESLMQEGFQDYLMKPLDVAELKRILDVYVANYKLELEETETVSRIREKRFFPDERLIYDLNTACANMDYDRAEELLLEILYYSYPPDVERHLKVMLECCEEFSYDELDRMAEELLGCSETAADF